MMKTNKVMVEPSDVSMKNSLIDQSTVAVQPQVPQKKRPKFSILAYLLSLRVKTLAVLIVLFVAMFAAFALVLVLIFSSSFTKLETKYSRDSTTRLTRVIYDDFANLIRLVTPFAAWDLTLSIMNNFVPDDAQFFLDDNWSDDMMISTNVDYILHYWLNGTFAYGKAYDSVNMTQIDIPDEIMELGADHPLVQPASESHENRMGGFMTIGGRLLFAASVPIQSGSFTGPSGGVNIIARYVHNFHVADLATRTQLCVTFLPAKNTNDPQAKRLISASKGVKPILIDVADANWKNNKAFAVSPLLTNTVYPDRQCWGGKPGERISQKRIASFAVVADLFGDPILFLRSDSPREIRKLGLQSILIAFALLAAIFTVAVVTILIFVERGVLNPTVALTKDVKQIADTNDIEFRVKLKTRDELGVMAANINFMLDTLETAQKELQKEKEKSERLLLNMLPEVISNRLKTSGAVRNQLDEDAPQPTKVTKFLIADTFPEVSVLFSDIVGFTVFASRLESTVVVDYLNIIFSAFDELCERNQIEKIKTIGDAFMCVAGCPTYYPDHANKAILQGLDMYSALFQINQLMESDINIRLGINSGAVVAGVIGTKKYVYDIFGDTVNVASRMESHGIPGHIHVSQSTYEYVKHLYKFEDRGEMSIKGKGKMRTYLLKVSDQGHVMHPVQAIEQINVEDYQSSRASSTLSVQTMNSMRSEQIDEY